MIQVHDIYCVLYFYFVAISAYSALTSGLAFTLLWESDADVTGQSSGGNVSGCKYAWSFSCSLAAHLLLWGLVPNGPWTSPGDPCPTGSKFNLLYIQGPSPPKPIDLLQSYLPLHTPKQADCFTCKSLEKSSIFQLLCFCYFLTSLVAQMVKRLPTMQETRVQSLSREDPLEEEMATHSSTLAWKIP